ncbi:MAG TPA: hypothetical protein VN739_10320 [Nitrososphaerales archaeon]|nr:hypothetical protein [Nitrososphaerales archaeon]
MKSKAVQKIENTQERGVVNYETCSKFRKRKKPKIFHLVVKIPSRGAPELPILATLAKSPSVLKTKYVLHQVKTNWFKELSETDLSGVYQESKKGIVDTVVKYSRKHLIEKGDLFAPSEENPIGTWRATPKGVKRAQSEKEGWKPTYVQVSAMIETVDNPRESGNGTA